MDELPVRLLNELITPAEVLTARNVKRTHDVRFCPIGVSMPHESRILICSDDDESIREFHYTPKAYYAVRVWETARDELLAKAEFSEALAVEWYPVAATFNSIRYTGGYPDKFIKRMSALMKRIANSGKIEITYGRFDAPATLEYPMYPRRFYIVPPDFFASESDYRTGRELEALQGKKAVKLSWEDIKDAFVVLNPIQLAFIDGSQMNRHTPLDDEFIHACEDFDFEKVKTLVEKGANIHAATEDGDTALSAMTLEYHNSGDEVDKDGNYVVDNRNHDKYIRIASYLLSLGYNIDIAGYGECSSTALHETNFLEDMDIVTFLLDHGADPNVPSSIGFEGPYGETALAPAWLDADLFPESKNRELARILLRRGALPVTRDETMDDLDEWIDQQKSKGLWDQNLCQRMGKFDAGLVLCARNMFFCHLVLLAQGGGNRDLRDERGRNLLQIALEDACPKIPDSLKGFINADGELMEMTLMLLCGLKLKLSKGEMKKAKQICRRKGYSEALAAIESVEREVVSTN